MAYRAEIEISVKGQRQLEQLRSTTNLSARAADSLRDSLAKSGGLNQTLQSYSNILETTSRTLKNVIFETQGETKAIQEYVTALGQSNEAAARQNRLIEAEVTLRNKAKKSLKTQRKREEFLAGPGRTIGAEKSAQRAAKDSARRQREFKQIEGYNRSIFKIEQGFNKQIRDYEIDTLLKTFKLEENLQTRLFQNALALDKKEGAAFDAELQRRVQATKAADRAASEARRLTGQTSPVGGAANIPGSPAAKRRTANRKAFTRGAGIGLATANIPGSSIAQAGALGSFAGPKGAAIAASVAAVAQAIAGITRLGPEVARTESQLSKLGIALRGILGSKSAEGFKAIDKAARDFNQPILDATRNFTQLSAAAIANGNSVKQTETLYRALSAATKATGGDAQDLNGVLRAATQVISKGVVRSEELRGQIGDRLPGAFQLFAQATNRSAEELQKALEQGEVSADEFVTTFANFILNKYEPAALRIGDSPAEAGARLTKALEDANRAAGPLLLSLGAKFQDFATKVLELITPALEALNKFLKLDVEGKKERLTDIQKNRIPELTKRTAELSKLKPNAVIADPNANFLSRIFMGGETLANVALKEAQKELDSLKGEATQLVKELFPKNDGKLASLISQTEQLKDQNAEHERALSLVKAQSMLDNGRIDLAQKRMGMESSIASARSSALLAINSLEMQRATNSGDTAKQLQLQVQRANLIYNQTVLQVQQEQKKAKLAALTAQIKLKELQANVQLRQAKGEANAADFAAIELQKQALQLTLEGVNASAQIAQFNLQTAGAIRQQTVEQAKFNSTAARASGSGGGGLGGGGATVYGGGTRSIGSATTGSLARALSAAGVTGTFSEAQAGGILAGKRQARVDAFQAATKGTTNYTSMPSNRQLERAGFAEGGYVTRPTNALIGEAGESEYVIPSSKMNSAMQRYSSGVRGEAVTAGAVAAGSTTNANYSSQQNMYYGGGAASVNITTGPVIRMGNNDYVSMSDLQRGMSTAANAGQANMMRSMRRSYGARRSMGA